MEKNIFKVSRKSRGYDLNALTSNGFYSVEAPLNAPAAGDGFVIVIERSWGAPSLLLVAQLFIDWSANTLYIRRLKDASWTAWTDLGAGGGGGTMTGADIVAALDTELGSAAWQGGGSTMTGSDIVAAIDAQLGSTVWQGGGGGGTMTGADIVDAINNELGGAGWQGYPLVSLHAGDRWIHIPSGQFPTTFGTNGTQPNIYESDQAGLVMGMGVNLAVGDNLRGLVRPVPTGSTWNVVFRLKALVLPMNYASAGVILRDSSGGKIMQFGYTAGSIGLVRWNSPTSYGDTPFITDNKLPPQMPEWFKIARALGKFRFYVSFDGIHWLFMHERDDTDWFGVAPDQVGVGLVINHASGSWPTAETDDGYMYVLYFDAPELHFAIPGFTNPSE